MDDLVLIAHGAAELGLADRQLPLAVLAGMAEDRRLGATLDLPLRALLADEDEAIGLVTLPDAEVEGAGAPRPGLAGAGLARGETAEAHGLAPVAVHEAAHFVDVTRLERGVDDDVQRSAAVAGGERKRDEREADAKPWADHYRVCHSGRRGERRRRRARGVGLMTPQVTTNKGGTSHGLRLRRRRSSSGREDGRRHLAVETRRARAPPQRAAGGR